MSSKVLTPSSLQTASNRPRRSLGGKILRNCSTLLGLLVFIIEMLLVVTMMMMVVMIMTWIMVMVITMTVMMTLVTYKGPPCRPATLSGSETSAPPPPGVQIIILIMKIIIMIEIMMMVMVIMMVIEIMMVMESLP